MQFRFEKLETWQLARAYNRIIYTMSRSFPKDETYGLRSQVRDAASSVSSNIAEGSGRNSDKDFGHFLEIAYGSLMETVSQSYLAYDESYISLTQLDEIKEAAHLLAGKISSLSKSLGRSPRISK